MRRRRAHYAGIQRCAALVMKVLFGYRIEGLENVPLEGSCLIAANHKSYLDPPAIGACVPREIHYFAKKQLFSIPVLGPVIRDLGSIPVDRGGFDRRALAAALHALKGGGALLLFPEGTRIRKMELGPAKEGLAMLALQSNAPVVPVYVGHTWEPRRGPFRRIPILIRFGPPLRFDAESHIDRRDRYRIVVDRVMEAISSLSEGDAPYRPRVPAENPTREPSTP